MLHDLSGKQQKVFTTKMPHLLLGQGMSQNLKEMTSETEKKQLTNCQSVICFVT